jgi:predicted NUDIX family NTP pyrophosphohydrolase
MPSPNTSAGLLLYRRSANGLEVFLAHPGGPFFRNKDAGVWTIPKGEIAPDEAPLVAALREFEEETGLRFDASDRFFELGAVRQKGGKTVHAWAVEGDCPSGHCLASNIFRVEWPPRSGKFQEFPEIDRAEFFPLPVAREKINPAQVTFLDRLTELLAREPAE